MNIKSKINFYRVKFKPTKFSPPAISFYTPTKMGNWELVKSVHGKFIFGSFFRRLYLKIYSSIFPERQFKFSIAGDGPNGELFYVIHHIKNDKLVKEQLACEKQGIIEYYDLNAWKKSRIFVKL